MSASNNPVKLVFDTDDPPPDADHALAFAGVYDERRRAIRAWHVTDDAAKIMRAVESGKPLYRMGHGLQELGPGLYMSAVPHLWMGRASSKWDFLKDMAEGKRLALADALGAIVLRQRQDQYITESEYERANKDLGYFAEKGHEGHVIQLAGQPYNIAFWKPEFLEPLGIRPGPEPEVVEFLVKGVFAGFDDQPTADEITDLVVEGLDGSFLRGGLFNMAQMVVWQKEAIVGMKKARL